MEFEITKMGERGQVVIPQSVRSQMSIHKGEKFMVITKDDTIIFKRLLAPSKKEVQDMFRRASKHAKEHGLTQKDMLDAIKKARSRK